VAESAEVKMRIVVLTIVLVLGAAAAADVGVDLLRLAQAGTADEVAAALAAGGGVDVVDDLGHTPLLLAAWHNTADVVALLLDAGADPHYTNPKTGMGIFGLVWRNPDGAAIRQLFDERELVAFAGVRPGSQTPAAPEGAPAPPDAPAARPSIDAPALPERASDGQVERLTPEAAAELGYVYRAGGASSIEDVRDWVTSRYALSGPLAADAFVNGCRASVLDLMRAPDSVLFGQMASVVIDEDGVISYTTYALAEGRDGASRRWSLSCTGFVEDQVLHLWVEIEAR
jgi:hypothetical protein